MIEIRDKKTCKYDLVSLGEVMLRLDPGDMRIKNTRSFTAWEGGGEYNVARGLRKCFGLHTAILTALARNDVGLLIEDLMLQGGVDTSMVKWVPFDGIGLAARNGLNFTERGYSVRGALGVSDRANTAASQMKPGDFDLNDLFGRQGVRWLHTGGIFAALSETTANLVLETVKKAKEYGTIVSYDLNYRASLWERRGGKEEAQRVNREIAPYVDVMIGNEEDFAACLGIVPEGFDESFFNLNLTGYEMTMKTVTKQFPNLKVAASTLRQVQSASMNSWSAICYSEEDLYYSKQYKDLLIYDRVGGGDSFASGLIYGLMELCDPKSAVEYGAAHGALAMTTPGDTSMASKSEVEALVLGKGARIKR